VEQDFLAKDPARKLKRPRTRKPDETRLQWAQYQTVIDAAASLRDKLAIKVGAATAVRPGELFAFRWQSFGRLANDRHVLKISETIYKSKIRPWAKTEGSCPAAEASCGACPMANIDCLGRRSGFYLPEYKGRFLGL